MTLTLHNIKPAPGAKKKRKRVGRGNASGHGTYSTRGQKGQRARSGGKAGLKRVGLKSLLQKIPKARGFKSGYAKPAVVNLQDLEKRFNDGALINAKQLLAKGLIRTAKNGVKILAEGELTKKLKIQADGFSQGALAKIKKAGGEAIIGGHSIEKEKRSGQARKKNSDII